MTRTYELMIVARPSFAGDDETGRKKLVESLIGTDGVSITSIALMGKKRLAYEINKQTEGVYLLATLTSRGLKSADIEKRSRVNEDCLRYLLVLKS